MLEPIWNEAAEKLVAELGPDQKAVMGKVDCDKEGISSFLAVDSRR
jgi:hypothetical protein